MQEQGGGGGGGRVGGGVADPTPNNSPCMIVMYLIGMQGHKTIIL